MCVWLVMGESEYFVIAFLIYFLRISSSVRRWIKEKNAFKIKNDEEKEKFVGIKCSFASHETMNRIANNNNINKRIQYMTFGACVGIIIDKLHFILSKKPSYQISVSLSIEQKKAFEWKQSFSSALSSFVSQNDLSRQINISIQIYNSWRWFRSWWLNICYFFFL